MLGKSDSPAEQPAMNEPLAPAGSGDGVSATAVLQPHSDQHPEIRTGRRVDPRLHRKKLLQEQQRAATVSSRTGLCKAE